jgi:hypothetical protein
MKISHRLSRTDLLLRSRRSGVSCVILFLEGHPGAVGSDRSDELCCERRLNREAA